MIGTLTLRPRHLSVTRQPVPCRSGFSARPAGLTRVLIIRPRASRK